MNGLRRISLKRIFAAIFVVLFAFVGYVAFVSVSEWEETKPLAMALKNARSVTLVELVTLKDDSRVAPGGRWPYVELRRREATPGEIQALADAAGFHLALDTDKMDIRCYEPHHRVIIKKADGSTFTLTICFTCAKYEFNEEGVLDTPQPWGSRLYIFFNSAGMPVRSEDEYMKLGKAITGSDYTY
jgi:hypothetical protein